VRVCLQLGCDILCSCSVLLRFCVMLMCLFDVVYGQADRIQQLYPEAERVRLQSGHCPHDDTPEEANDALLAWLGNVYKS
jgi:hypothetical protein